METIKSLNPEDVRKVRQTALAEKHGVSLSYVIKLLKGEREVRSKKAKAIMQDAHAIVDIINEKVNDNTNRLTEEMIKSKTNK